MQWRCWAEKEGVEVQKYHANGNAYGVFWIPTAMDSDRNYNRRFSGIEHWLQVPPRPNYHLITEHRVVKVNFEKFNWFQKAISLGVQLRLCNGAFIIKARKEIILSASTVRTPQILQLSGAGPREVLKTANIDAITPECASGARLSPGPPVVDYRLLSNPADLELHLRM
ncbi:GMC oxidoreductase [Karstenula rhodostoma CBS 690.94]|uniref:GMC oxidoreductase n=1 Tax=Karstenula rhodostoma CBS 690.94 TaxID=1392251 RepID=A0A9P4U420_9PLEO|nr:GMC oxidoreductase [Karstenula rhodostoma CBS 690.94]